METQITFTFTKEQMKGFKRHLESSYARQFNYAQVKQAIECILSQTICEAEIYETIVNLIDNELIPPTK